MKSLHCERGGEDDLGGYGVEHLWGERVWEEVAAGVC